MLSDYLIKKKLKLFCELRNEVLENENVVKGWKIWFTEPSCWAWFAVNSGLQKDELERVCKIVKKTKDFELLQIKSLIESVYEKPEMIVGMKTANEMRESFGPIFPDE